MDNSLPAPICLLHIAARSLNSSFFIWKNLVSISITLKICKRKVIFVAYCLDKCHNHRYGKIGFAPTVYSDWIGLDFQDGQVWVYDHYNQVHIDGLTQYIEALNAIGAQSESPLRSSPLPRA
jgi:hypothetical protein